MLSEFQQAFADLVASPELCIEARRNPELLRERYELTAREWQRLVGIVNHRGMECNCMLYRANRLAPVALNLPELCKALATDLRPMLSEYWSKYPNTDVHFMVESERFCQFLREKLEAGYPFRNEIRQVLEEESALLSIRIEASYTEREGQAAEVTVSER
jgi:hypothetical protein